MIGKGDPKETTLQITQQKTMKEEGEGLWGPLWTAALKASCPEPLP